MKIYPAIIAIALLLAAAPVALAANGDGQVLSYKPNVASTGDSVTLQIKLYNDATDGKCIDEILIMPPDNWTGTASVDKYSRSAYSYENKESNDNINLVSDSQSVRIIPTNMLCVGETVEIEISGLIAPGSYEVSEIVIKTSDQFSNSGPSQVYKTIDTPIPGTLPPFALPKVYVTKATKIGIEYFRITDFVGSGGSKGFKGRAWGADARLNQMAIQASAAGSLQIRMETGTTDIVIFNGNLPAPGTYWITMNYPVDSNPMYNNGYLEDQAGARDYYITYTGTLTLLGSNDQILDDEDLIDSGLTGAKGTIITAGSSESRKVLVKLTDNNNYDVKEIIPLETSFDSSELQLVEVAPYTTDSRGEAFFTLKPECLYGVHEFEVLTDPLKTQPDVTEYVGVNAGAPYSFDITEGSGAYVPAKGSQLIEVKVYDQCGNEVSNTDQLLVEFDLLSTCGAMLADVPGGIISQNNHHEEETDMGVADAYLVTGCTLCTHTVQVTVEGFGSENIYLYGVNGPPVKMQVTLDDDDITADQCVEATIEVVDECGNVVSEIPSEVGDEMEEWESIVRVTIENSLMVDQPGWASSSFTYISDSDFREEQIYNGYPNPYVQGKLRGGVGHVDICGCQGLGTYDIVAISDTIDEGRETVNVKNAPYDCIEVDTVDQLLQCEKNADINVAIKDICGNYMTNQACGTGQAEYCVDLGLSGTCDEGDAELSTDTVCIDIGSGGPGYLEIPVELERLTDDCCELDISAAKGQGCCGDFPPLQVCEPVNVLFHGAPSYMTTEFFKTRKICGPACPVGAACVEEIQGGQTVQCYEQLHESLFNGGIDRLTENGAEETVSEEVLDLFSVYDKCGHIVKDYNGTIDVEVRGEDTASIYQVDHPLTLEDKGLCEGKVQCRALTQFGEDKCEETEKCSWNQDGHCSGTPVCTVINHKNLCGQAGCTWIGGSATEGYYCAGTSTRNCNVIANQGICQNVGCAWTDTSTCQGDAVNNNCAPYTKEQCQMVGGAVAESCEWIADCTTEFENSILKKLVIHNSKPETQKQWIPLENDDIIVDKLAFQLTYEEDPALWLYVYLENEQTPGFQNGQDRLIGEAPALFGEPTIIELEDSPTPYSDDQRQGGVLIRAGDSRDFYVMLVNERGPMPYIPCGTYGLEFLWYQDYNSPDLTNFGSGYPDPDYDGIIEVNQLGGVVEDTCIDSDNFNWIDLNPRGPGSICPNSGPGMNLRKDARNDDYRFITPDYGFGDRFLYNLKFDNGQAWIKFRDLVAEDVKVYVSDVFESGYTCKYDVEIDEEEGVQPNPEEITFNAQPATQIKLINHDEGSKTAVCEDEWDPKENAYLFNIQVTDGFDNPVGKQLEIELEYCLKMPFGDWMIENVLWKYCISHGDEDVCDELWMDKERCFTREDLRKLIQASEYAHGFENLLFGDFFGEEFADWMETYFEEAKVEFWDTGGHALNFDSHGHQVVMTDSNGQAQVYVTAQKTGVYKIIARPLALDGDWAMVSFNAGIPAKLDLMAVPAFGIPADGEEEAMLFLRALDECGNLVHEPIYGVTVAVTQGTQVYISQDFECKNNYDSDVTGTLYPKGFLGESCLAVLSDLPQTATITASQYSMESDTTQIAFQGAPVKLAIAKIEPSDRLPADGQTGAWVTIQVQDKNSNRVTGYLGNGFSSDPGDPWGFTDYKFETICIDLDDLEAKIPGWFMTLFGNADIEGTTYGWINFHQTGPSTYCGDLMFGEGKVYVTYGNPNCNHGGTVNVKVWDAEPWQGQEFDKNGIPVSVEATQLRAAFGHVDFVDPASQWNLMADKLIALADGKSTVRIEVQIENEYMDVRQPVEGVLYIGGTAQNGAALSWNGAVDALNPTSARFITDPLTGNTYLELTSTKPGVAEITVTGGDAYICQGLESWSDSICIAQEMSECTFAEMGMAFWEESGLSACVKLGPAEVCTYGEHGEAMWMQFGKEWCRSRAFEYCESANFALYTCPGCEQFIQKWDCHYSPLEDITPKTIEVEFLEVASKQIFLDKGWNFISVPYALNTSADQLSELFNMSNVVQAWRYNGGWVALSGSDTLAPLNGYWIKLLQPEVITLKYATPTMPSIPTRSIAPGWNAVGLAWDSPITMRNGLMSIDKIYSNVIGWIAGLQKYAIPVANTGGSGPFETGGVNIEPKQGYWVWATGSGTLAGLAA